MDGYEENKSSSSPFWGYQFRILTAQGEAAPGSRKSYVVNGDLSGGFALLAYPAKYASSGVMTFIVNQDGVVSPAVPGVLNQVSKLQGSFGPETSFVTDTNCGQK
jgi:hypothetical protein